jgi:hypothetical protein
VPELGCAGRMRRQEERSYYARCLKQVKKSTGSRLAMRVCSTRRNVISMYKNGQDVAKEGPRHRFKREVSRKKADGIRFQHRKQSGSE